MKSQLARYEILLFFVITLLIGWFPWYAGDGGLFIFAPTLSAIIVAFLFNGWEGVFDIFRRLGRWRSKANWYLFALFSPAVIYLIAIVVHMLLGGDLPGLPMFKENQQMLLLTFVYFLLPWQSSAFLEEVGLRGYALEKLQNSRGPMIGTLILGVFFGAWLLPEFFQADSAQVAMGGLSFFPWFVLQEIGWSILMTFAYNNTNKSSLIAGYLFHTAFNFWSMVLLTNAIPGESMPSFDATLFIWASVIVALVGAILLYSTKGKLGFTPDEA